MKNLEALRQITTPERWQSNALAAEPIPSLPGRKRRLLLAAAVILALCCGTAVGAGIYQHDRNAKIVANQEEMLADAEQRQLGDHYNYRYPISDTAPSLETYLQDQLCTAESWHALPDLYPGADLEVTCDDGPVWARQITWPFNDDTLTITETTAQAPSLLLSAEAPIHLDWADRHYDGIPYGNKVSVTTNSGDGSQWTEFQALYTGDEDAYFSLRYLYSTQHSTEDPAYLLSSDFSGSGQLESYTTSTGAVCTIAQQGNWIMAECQTDHFGFTLFSADLALDEVKEILEHLDLDPPPAPANCSLE